MLDERIAKAINALRAAGHRVETVPGATNVYRIEDGDAVTGSVVLALAIRLGLLD
ncbi:MAG: hypothetical protein INR71_06365 [Terriglobus roseus]|nr:hypothetical protein [Terriglobus roseus]